MVELTGKEKLIALELLKELREVLCIDCQKEIDQLVMKIAYS